jgi:hypothetical protein
MAREIERRHNPRIEVNWPVIVITPQRYIGGEAKNISINGVFVHCLTDPGQSEPFRLAIKAPTREELLVVNAEAVWSDVRDYSEIVSFSGIGVRFTGFMGDSRQFLSSIIAEHLKSE